MSRIHFAAAAAVTASLAAQAAQAEPEEFAGFYAGVHTGYMDATADFDNGGDLSEDGLMGGLQMGLNFAAGNVIWGVETDISLTGADPNGGCPFLATASCDVDVQAVGTLRARVGYVVMNDLLLYVTGGAAGGKFKAESSGTIGNVNFTTEDTDRQYGWTAGAGLEYLVGSSSLPGEKNVGVKVEYRYMNFNDFDIDNVPRLGEQEIDIDSHAVLIGLNWHF